MIYKISTKPFGITPFFIMVIGFLLGHLIGTVISMIGSYFSETYANDNNDHFWKIPNVIGITSN